MAMLVGSVTCGAVSYVGVYVFESRMRVGCPLWHLHLDYVTKNMLSHIVCMDAVGGTIHVTCWGSVTWPDVWITYGTVKSRRSRSVTLHPDPQPPNHPARNNLSWLLTCTISTYVVYCIPSRFAPLHQTACMAVHAFVTLVVNTPLPIHHQCICHYVIISNALSLHYSASAAQHSSAGGANPTTAVSQLL